MKLWWEPRGFALVEFVDSVDASEAQYHMNRQMFSGREITVVLAAETRKRPQDMRRRTRVRGYSDHEGRRTSRYGWSHSRSRSSSRSPRHRGRARSRRRDDYSASPKRKEERRAKSPRRSKEHDVDKKRRSYTPDDRNGLRDWHVNKVRSATPDREGSRRRRRSPRPSSVTPPGSADDNPARSN